MGINQGFKFDENGAEDIPLHIEDRVDSLFLKAVSLVLKFHNIEITNEALNFVNILAQEHLHSSIANLVKIANIQRRRQPAASDVGVFLQLHNIRITDLEEQRQIKAVPYIMAEDSALEDDTTLLFADIQSQSIKKLVISHKKRGSYIPSWMPEFPPDHTFMSTPQYANRVKDPRQLREQLVIEGRLAEAALRRLTGMVVENGEEEVADEENDAPNNKAQGMDFNSFLKAGGGFDEEEEEEDEDLFDDGTAMDVDVNVTPQSVAQNKPDDTDEPERVEGVSVTTDAGGTETIATQFDKQQAAELTSSFGKTEDNASGGISKLETENLASSLGGSTEANGLEGAVIAEDPTSNSTTNTNLANEELKSSIPSDSTLVNGDEPVVKRPKITLKLSVKGLTKPLRPSPAMDLMDEPLDDFIDESADTPEPPTTTFDEGSNASNNLDVLEYVKRRQRELREKENMPRTGGQLAQEKKPQDDVLFASVFHIPIAHKSSKELLKEYFDSAISAVSKR